MPGSNDHSEAARLASPRDLIVFDGVCHLCSGWVGFVLPRDTERRFLFVPAQSPLGQRLMRDHDVDPEDPETLVLIRSGRAYLKSDAILRVLDRLPRWRWTALFRIVPKTLRDWLYDRVARNRYRLFGRRDQCLVDLPGADNRFLWEDST